MHVENINPFTGQVEYRYQYYTPAQVEATIAAATAAFPAWSGLSYAQRAALLNRVAAVLRENQSRIARFRQSCVLRL